MSDDDDDDKFAKFDCPGCQGGDKWPADEDTWTCPVCDAQFWCEDEADSVKDQPHE